MAQTTQDDAFHEIQLNGKQLFFLFMAATVVSVVIFLCGVLVGRGVRSERGVAAEGEALSISPPAPDVQPPTAAPAPAPTSAGADLTVVPPPPAADDLEPGHGTSKAPGKDAGGPADPKIHAAAPVARDPKPAPVKPGPVKSPVAPAPKAAPIASATTQPPATGDNFAVQVTALNARSAADAFAKDLTTKGYDAYVVPPSESNSSYRVRVGRFKSKREADVLNEKLRKEQQLKGFVTH